MKFTHPVLNHVKAERRANLVRVVELSASSSSSTHAENSEVANRKAVSQGYKALQRVFDWSGGVARASAVLGVPRGTLEAWNKGRGMETAERSLVCLIAALLGLDGPRYRWKSRHRSRRSRDKSVAKVLHDKQVNQAHASDSTG